MNTLYRSFYTRIGAVLLAVAFAARAEAETPRQELVHAYILLARANADYHGHRLSAMNQIEAAGKKLGLHLGGDATGDELQLKSDEQLLRARTLLAHARGQLDERDRIQVAIHVDAAIREIDAALPHPVAPVRVESPREELVHAYILLAHANADYEGHRLNAMHQIEAAGKDLGLHLGGDATGDERQLKSDEQLAAARKLLVHAREKLDDKDRPRVAARVETAVKEIDAALKFAAIPRGGPVVHIAPPAPRIESPREELVHAYVLLSHANADYKGHRLNAMNEIEVAGKALGLSLKGDATGDELQLKSDEQLAAARKLLLHVREKLEESDRARAVPHVVNAIREISAGLTVK